jgi:hypothetical protein
MPQDNQRNDNQRHEHTAGSTHSERSRSHKATAAVGQDPLFGKMGQGELRPACACRGKWSRSFRTSAANGARAQRRRWNWHQDCQTS